MFDNDGSFACVCVVCMCVTHVSDSCRGLEDSILFDNDVSFDIARALTRSTCVRVYACLPAYV